MSRDIATTTSNQPLSASLFQLSTYKPTQGRIARQLTSLAIWVIFAMGCYRFSILLRGAFPSVSWLESVLPLGIFLAGAWFGFRVVNWPRFADFLIAVEAEMAKVTWPSRAELIRASVVVIVTLIILAIALFAFDIVWQWFFGLLGITS